MDSVHFLSQIDTGCSWYHRRSLFYTWANSIDTNVDPDALELKYLFEVRWVPEICPDIFPRSWAINVAE